jgi:hypothetical protein
MKVLLLLAACATALALTATASAAPKPQPGDGFATAPVNAPFTVKELSASEARSLGVPKSSLPGVKAADRAGGASTYAAGPCGACIVTCWTVLTHTGTDTSTGSYWENVQPVWCGNGSWITYADVSRHWQTVSIWYSADGESGPWFDGGCVGCTSIHYTVYGYFSWHPPIWPGSHTTVRLGVWLQAYGAAAYA